MDVCVVVVSKDKRPNAGQSRQEPSKDEVQSIGEYKRKKLAEDMGFSLLYYVLSGRGQCEGPIPRPEEFYRFWCVIMCVLDGPGTRWAVAPEGKKLYYYFECIKHKRDNLEKRNWIIMVIG
jgi:hypothetical protein